jgi:integrase
MIPRGERTWLVRIYTGRDPQTGKRTYANHTVHGTKKDAQQYLNGVLRERDLGTFAGVNTVRVGALLDDLLRDYRVNGKSINWVEDVVRVHLRPFFGAMKAASVGTDQLQAYTEKRQKSHMRKRSDGQKDRRYGPAANGTINREMALLRRAFNLGAAANPPKVARVPSISMLAENNVRKGFFEHEPFVAVRRALPEEIRPVITFAYCTGCRKAEILGLQWPQIDLTERIVRLEPGETKNDQARLIPLVSELYEMLVLQKAMRDQYWPESPWVFSRTGEPIKNFSNAWEKACKVAGLVSDKGKPARLFHDLRRTGVRNLIRAGVPERVAMMISGHKTRAVFDRYNIVSERDLKEAGRRLDEYLAHKDTQADERHTIGTQTPKAAVN